MSSSAPQFDGDLLRRGRLTASVDGAVLSLRLDRPEVRNAQVPATWEALAHIGARLSESIRVVVVRGSGPAFSAGLDRSARAPGPDSVFDRIASAPPAVADEMIAGYQQGFTWLSDPGFVSIAAVQGFAIGAGFQLALACDLLIAADDAQFSMAEVTLGLVPDLTGSARLVAAVGRQRALEMCVTGRRITADEAVRTGIALMAVPAAELEATVSDLVMALTEAEAETVRAVTRLINGADGRDLGGQLAAERSEQIGRIRALAVARSTTS